MRILVLVTAFWAVAPVPGADRPVHFKFDFGPGKVAAGYTQVLATTLYTRETGFGFEPGAKVACLDRGGSDPLRGDLCAGEAPFYFSVAVPEGNYRVTVTLGDPQAASAATIKAELRRLMVERVETAAGEFASVTFLANVRTPEISTGGVVRLKDREKTSEAWAWDEKLTLEFNNSRPAVAAMEIDRADGVPTLYLLGDSTVTDQPREPWNSWGQMLTRFFEPEVAVANHAESGESLRDSINERRLDKVLSLIKPGDYLFVQMGHNDEKEKGEGVGAFTTYKADLKRYVAEARKKGATPVVVTPVHRRTFDDQGRVSNSHGDYPEAVRQVAREDGVALIDLAEMSKLFYEALGPVESAKAFVDGTHHNSYGSYELARCVVEGIKQARLPLAKHLTREAASTTFDPSHPDPPADFKIPASPAPPSTQAPYGQ
jgi:lysophospholipase L1-like esterase